MNRTLTFGIAVAVAIGAAVALFPSGDLDIDVPEAEPVERNTQARIEHVDDGDASASNSTNSKVEDDGTSREGSASEDEAPYIHPAAAAANARRHAPYPQWSNKARPAWKAIDYRLRQLGDDENAAIAIEVVDALMAVNREVEPDVEPLVKVQSAALSKLKGSPNADEIDALLVRVEGLIEELQTLPPAELDE